MDSRNFLSPIVKGKLHNSTSENLLFTAFMDFAELKFANKSNSLRITTLIGRKLEPMGLVLEPLI
ncbi:MAG: hypothetical protein DCF19_23820 [Pseudanabaena frigida]|uniref:Uncharacterized protein n=1 Tax=Pseudanabaena frigida TaxID=945775 RepID=A0A2W4VSN4_9CYAN|nr:MAG: hypothetical protein DCF19_23820 [Pseudanabaena frigida]